MARVSAGTIQELELRGRVEQWLQLHIKNGDTSQFLFEITVEILTAELIPQLVRLYNGRLKVDRLCQGVLMRTI